MRDLEDNAVMKFEMSTYTPEVLGYLATNYHANKYKEKRHSVLNKMSKLGQELSPAQKSDFAWFKDEWDKKMCQEYGDEWGNTFAMLMQHTLDEITAGVTNAFSVMMHSETRRLLNSPALRL